jgi:acetyl-CoA carboxylase carboxyl transferase subunit beta
MAENKPERVGWFKRMRGGIQTSTHEKKDTPEGVWYKCVECKKTSTLIEYENNLWCCPNCSYHGRIGSRQYFPLLFDDEQYELLFENIRSTDALNFKDLKDYESRLVDAIAKTGYTDAISVGTGKIDSYDIVIACMNFEFIGGSMGTVVGERISRGIDYCIQHRFPLLIISKSGGARMMESAYSLMQLAKTSAKLTMLAKNKLPYISLLTDPTTFITDCEMPGGYVANNLDCNDINSSVNPDAVEICNSIDDNCDGFIDEGLLSIFFDDADADSYGDALTFIAACEAPAGYVENNIDCNDSSSMVHPLAAELCNNEDDDCDGSIDDELLLTTYYLDADNDNYGNAFIDTTSCLIEIAGYVFDSTDCDDSNPLIYPDATEIANNLDDNCNDLIDEGLVGINNLTYENAITIYPNPANDKITISLNTQLTNQHINQITITDLSGKIVSQLNNELTEVEIDVSNYASGIYFVKVNINDEQSIQKLIIE